MTPLKLKKERAEKVFNTILNDFLKEFPKSTDNDKILASKKTSRIIKNTEKKLNSSDINDKIYISLVTELHNKISDRLNELGIKNIGEELQEKINWMNKIKFIVIFDIDDTMRDAEHRMHIREEIFKLQEKRNEVEKDSDLFFTIGKKVDSLWDDFFREGVNDKPRPKMFELCNKYYDLGFDVKFRTGASEKYLKETEKYLKDNGAKYNELRMRKIGVRIPDYVLKPAWIPKYDGAENVFAIYDDRDPVNKKYQEKGVIDTIKVDRNFDVDKHLIDFKDKIESVLPFLKKNETK